MGLKFTALPVEEGDAFLLQDGEWNCLFDAGVDKKIVDILGTTYKITQIDLAICSHNDEDHAEGFKELLQSNIKIKEIWLPSLWASILQFMITNRGSGNIYVDIERIIDSVELSTIKEDNLNSLFNDDTIFEDELRKQVDDFSKRFEDFKRKHKYSKRRKNRKIDFSRIIEIATLAYNNGCTIKWFEPYHCCPCIFKDKGFIALNSLPISEIKMIKSTQQVTQAVYLSAENMYSLIFEYYKDEKPVVRFSADSDCTCYSQPYNNSIIITAPHHGSKSNKNVYSIIHGDDIIWVRTYHKKVQVGCNDFLHQTNRYCVKCSMFKTPGEIGFDYTNGTWNYKCGRICNC